MTRAFRPVHRLGIIALAFALVGCAAFARAQTILETLRLPEGFAIDVYARVPGARSLALAPELGVLFVSSRGSQIYAVPLRDDDTVRPTYPVLSRLKVPNGIAWRDGYLYVAEQHRLTRYHVPSLSALESARPEILFQDLPDKSWHGWRYIAFAPADVPGGEALYMGVGAPCNICVTLGYEGAILRFTPGDWAHPETVAKGVRNTVGFDAHPATKVLHFTDNGADGMGDDSPPDELNALAPGGHYGFPWYGGGDHKTGILVGPPPPADVVFPVHTFQAHVAALGIDFYTGTHFPKDYENDAFVAQHGSWNRSVPIGYRVMHVRFDAQGRVQGAEPFITGWLRPNGEKLGRPVDVEELPDGSLLISDDRAGLVYRVTYSGP